MAAARFTTCTRFMNQWLVLTCWKTYFLPLGWRKNALQITHADNELSNEPKMTASGALIAECGACEIVRCLISAILLDVRVCFIIVVFLQFLLEFYFEIL